MCNNKIIIVGTDVPGGPSPMEIIALHKIKKIKFCFLDFRHIYNLMPTDRRGRRSLQNII